MNERIFYRMYRGVLGNENNKHVYDDWWTYKTNEW